MTNGTTGREAPSRPSGPVAEVFWVFLRLGLTSFGGPVAHLGYFREAFVERRRWLTDRAYADLVALCQFLPGPASSQVGMAIGLQRAGLRGLLAAWFAFTMPSAIVLVAFAYGVMAWGDVAGAGWLAGLKAAAVAVVAHAVVGMARSLTPDLPRAVVALAAMAVLLFLPHPVVQVAVLVAGGLIGVLLLRGTTADSGARSSVGGRISRRAGAATLTVAAGLLVLLPALTAATGDPLVELVDLFYRAGALVFGGGHVVLPLLEAETVRAGLVEHDTFLAGYGAAQAVPGPLLTFAGYLGATMTDVPSPAGAALALVAVFLPAALLVIGVLPFWARLQRSRRAREALLGVNAAVVGVLAAAFCNPVVVQGVTSLPTLLLAITVYVGLARWRLPAWAAVLGAAAVGLAVL